MDRIIEIGDSVVFSEPGIIELLIGEVVDITPKMMRVKFVRNGETVILSKYHKSCARV